MILAAREYRFPHPNGHNSAVDPLVAWVKVQQDGDFDDELIVNLKQYGKKEDQEITEAFLNGTRIARNALNLQPAVVTDDGSRLSGFTDEEAVVEFLTFVDYVIDLKIKYGVLADLAEQYGAEVLTLPASVQLGLYMNADREFCRGVLRHKGAIEEASGFTNTQGAMLEAALPPWASVGETEDVEQVGE